MTLFKTVVWTRCLLYNEHQKWINQAIQLLFFSFAFTFTLLVPLSYPYGAYFEIV